VGEDNGHKPDSSQVTERKVYSLVICYDPVAERFDVKGLTNGIVVNLGMLKYAEIMIRRHEVELAMYAAQLAAPRIAVPGGRL
jgi:hypothetical protein